MIYIAKQILVMLLATCIVACGLPRPSRAGTPLPRGASSAAAAAAPVAPSAAGGEVSAPADTVARAAAAGEPVLALGALAAFEEPDTTEFEFPDDDRDTLVRDITVWVIASAFVAFFVIKVFLEEDEEEPEDNSPPGKQI